MYQTPPKSAYPTDVYQRGQRLLVRDNFDEPDLNNSRAQTFHEFIQMLDQWETQLLEKTQLHYEPQRTAELLNDGCSLFVASDGSICPEKCGSFGFTVTHVSSKTRLMMGQGPVPGHEPSSFRAEAYGALAVGRLLVRLSEFTGIEIRQRVFHWIDNEGVVNRIKAQLKQPQVYPSSTLQPDWDVIHEIGRTFSSLPEIQYQPKWIKSHQDSTKDYRQLSLAAQMNCDADALCSGK